MTPASPSDDPPQAACGALRWDQVCSRLGRPRGSPAQDGGRCARSMCRLQGGEVHRPLFTLQRKGGCRSVGHTEHQSAAGREVRGWVAACGLQLELPKLPGGQPLALALPVLSFSPKVIATTGLLYTIASYAERGVPPHQRAPGAGSRELPTRGARNDLGNNQACCGLSEVQTQLFGCR